MYKSDAQRRFFHTDTARRKGISAAVVKEFDDASRGAKLPDHVRAANRKRTLSQVKLSKEK